MNYVVSILPFLGLLALSSCRQDPGVLEIPINSQISQQVIPPGAKNVIIRPGVPSADISASKVTGKFQANGKEFNFTGSGLNAIAYISAEPCVDFGGGVKEFKYQLFQNGALYKQDTAKVEVICR